MRRTLIFIAAGLLVLLVGGAIALPMIVDVNQYRELIQTEAEKAIGRRVTLGEMSLSLFPTFGISVAPIEVQDLVTAKSVTVGARLWPLIFGGEIVVSTVVIESPEVMLTRRADGTWSATDLAGTPAAGDEPAEPPSTRNVSLSKLKVIHGLVHLRNEAPEGPPSLDLTLDLEGSMRMTGEETKAEATGRVATIGDDAIAADLDAEVTQSAAGSIIILSADAARGSSSLKLQGTIDIRGGRTIVDLTVPSSEIVADDLRALLAAAVGELPFRISAHEPVRFDARVKGDIASDDLQIAANVEVSDATFEHPSMKQPMREIRGKLKVEGERLDLTDFHAVIGTSDVGGSLSVENFDAPSATFALKSKKADFMELMSFLEEEGPPAPQGQPSPDAGSSDTLAALRARGTLAIEEGSFGSLDFSDLDSTLSLENKVIRLEPVSMSLYDGRMSGTATMSMAASPPTVSVQARAETIGVGPLLGDTLDMKDMLSGALTGDLSIAAAGDALDPILRSASGTGDIRIENGRVGALNVLGILSRASGLLGEKSLKAVSDKLAKEGTDFSSIEAALKIGGGKISTSNLRLVSPDIDLTDDGTLDMLAGRLAIEGRVIFSEAISQAMVDEGSRAVDVFWDDAIGRVSLPLKLAGPVDAPMPDIDWNSAGGRLARNKIEEALRKKGLGDLFGGGSKGPEKSEAANTPDPGALVGEGDPGPLDVSIQRKEFSGNLLAPDLKIRGTLRGANITEASLEVLDRDGRQVHETSLMKQVSAAAAAAGGTADAAAGIKFKVDVEGRKLVQAGRKLAFAIKLKDELGHSVTKRWEVER